MADPILVIAWLVLAHVAADFILQTGGVALAKAGRGRRAMGGLVAHGLIVAVCTAPIGLAYGSFGWTFVAIVAIGHVVIDRVKVVLTRRSVGAALAAAHSRHESPPPPEHLGRAWTPRPAALFLADQAAHLALIGIAWATIPPAASLQQGWVDVVNWALGTHDRAAVHQIASVFVVGLILLIVNVRAASLFVGILVRPVEGSADGDQRWGSRAAPAVARARGLPRPARSRLRPCRPQAGRGAGRSGSARSTRGSRPSPRPLRSRCGRARRRRHPSAPMPGWARRSASSSGS